MGIINNESLFMTQWHWIYLAKEMFFEMWIRF